MANAKNFSTVLDVQPYEESTSSPGCSDIFCARTVKITAMATHASITGQMVSLYSREWSSKEVIVASYVGLLFAVLYFLQPVSKRKSLKVLPTVGAEQGDEKHQQMQYMLSGDAVLQQAYDQFKDRISRVATKSGDWFVVPLKYVDELKPIIEDYVGCLFVVRKCQSLRGAGKDKREHN